MLKDLSVLKEETQRLFRENFKFSEYHISNTFKEKVSRIGTSFVEYYDTTFVVTSKENLSIIAPNQWFYLASYFVDYYIELIKYKDLVISYISDKEEIKKCKDDIEYTKKLFIDIDVDSETKSKLFSFLSDYSWWGGAKTIDRGDFFVSPILSMAQVVNASQSYVADLVQFLSNNLSLRDILRATEKSAMVVPEKIVAARNSVLKTFAYYVFRYFEKIGVIDDFLPFSTSSDSEYFNDGSFKIKLQNESSYLTGLFLSNITSEKLQSRADRDRWFDVPIVFGGKNVFFSTQWVNSDNSNYQLKYSNLVGIVYSLFGDRFHFVYDGIDYVLYDRFEIPQCPVDCSTKFVAPASYIQYITAIKTKPFVLLAGISGTGKSRIVRQLARACDTIDANPWEVQKPQNFEMIQVRPDWHDGSELLGYESRISGKGEYVVKNFVKFIVKAWIYEDENVPFFLCLDEMNLAPVEQYFAEYLSVVESRRVDETGKIVCDPLIRLNKEYCQSIANEIYGASESDENDALHLSGVESLMSILEGLDYCIPLPKNLIVMGTVNMDETTFSFSRKVLDRAMTIEMNEVDLKGGLVDVEKERFAIAPEQILPDAVEGKDVYASNEALCDKVIQYLQQVNDVLEGTPFKIAYRTRNEFLIYAVNRGEEHLLEALDEMTSMKILSRIEGDQEKIKDLLDRLKEVMEKSGIGSDSQSIKKIKEMNDRLGSGYTSYWS